MEDRADHRQKLGQAGEYVACRYLEGMGHTILERNWRSGHLEIDIISTDADGIHFVEVKARQRNIQAPPQDNVGALKQKRIVKASLAYLNTAKGRPHKNMECFFDVMAVTFDDEGTHVEWIPQAYIPLYI
jgi:putative endonuclease